MRPAGQPVSTGEQNYGGVTTKLSAIGEKAYLSALLPRLFVDPRLESGFGDDSAVVDCGLDSYNLILNIDRVPISTSLIPFSEDDRVWGRLLVTACCSDILASGGVPHAVLMAIAVPGNWLAERVDAIVFGCQQECRRRGIVFAGGDTKEAQVPHLVGSVVGLVPKGGALYRNRARAGDLAVIAGDVGGFMAAYFLLKSLSRDNSFKSNVKEWLGHLLYPQARWREADLLRNYADVAAAMDASDGLYDALVTLCDGGRLGLTVSLEHLPYHHFVESCEKELGIPATNLAFGAGDWIIVYAMKQKCFEEIVSRTGNKHKLTAIGTFGKTPGIYASDGHGSVYTVSAPVNEHFRTRFEDAGDFMNRLRTGNILTKMRA